MFLRIQKVNFSSFQPHLFRHTKHQLAQLLTYKSEKLITSKNIIGALVSEPESIHAGTIVFIPGWSGSREDFVAVMPILTSLGWHCFSIDQHGQPASYGSNKLEDFTLDSFAQDLIDIANNFSEPIHVIGHSFGGIVSQYAAIREAEALLLDMGKVKDPTSLTKKIASSRDFLSLTAIAVIGLGLAIFALVIWAVMA